MLAVSLLLGFSSASEAEYLIYLKGGHFIIADNCRFSTSQIGDKGVAEGMRSNEPSKSATGGATGFALDETEDCTQGKPEGQIFWSTINGNFGEVNVDDVYAILGTKTPPVLKPSSSRMPLEDYLITNRGESFVNARVVEEKRGEVHGLKRDDLSRFDRRDVIGIDPERVLKSRSGEGLCPGEPAEFSVSEVEIVDGRLIGVITNLSKISWRPWIDIEISVKGKRLGKFQADDPNTLSPNDNTALDSPVPARFLKDLEQLKNAEAGLRLCYRKVKTATKGVGAEKSPLIPSP